MRAVESATKCAKCTQYGRDPNTGQVKNVQNGPDFEPMLKKIRRGVNIKMGLDHFIGLKFIFIF
jgi:hypothetical protein